MNRKERISKSKGVMMILSAVVFDLLPILILLGAILLFVQGVSSVGIVGKIMFLVSGVAALGVAIVAGPVIYFVFSFINIIFANLFFFTWFILNGVNIFSLKKPKKAVVTLLTTFFEMIPFVNIFPSITLMVVYNIKHAQKEDREEYKKSVSLVAKRMVALGAR